MNVGVPNGLDNVPWKMMEDCGGLKCKRGVWLGVKGERVGGWKKAKKVCSSKMKMKNTEVMDVLENDMKYFPLCDLLRQSVWLQEPHGFLPSASWY